MLQRHAIADAPTSLGIILSIMLLSGCAHRDASQYNFQHPNSSRFLKVLTIPHFIAFYNKRLNRSLYSSFMGHFLDFGYCFSGRIIDIGTLDDGYISPSSKLESYGVGDPICNLRLSNNPSSMVSQEEFIKLISADSLQAGYTVIDKVGFPLDDVLCFRFLDIKSSRVVAIGVDIFTPATLEDCEKSGWFLPRFGQCNEFLAAKLSECLKNPAVWQFPER